MGNESPVGTHQTIHAVDRPRRGPRVRNRVLVLPSVICSHVVADSIASRVPAAVSAPHDHGCAQLGDDKATTRRTMVNLARNPNVAGTLVVGLGCESIQSDTVVEEIRAAGVPVESVVIQEMGGTDACIEAGIVTARDLVDGDASGRDPVDIDELTIGVVTSDMHASSINHAEPVVGQALERIVDAGGRVVVAGGERFRAGAEHLADRLATTAARDGFASLRERDRPADGRTLRRRKRAASLPTDSRLGVIGDGPLRDVVGYGERPGHATGFALVDAPRGFAESATALAAAGAQLIVHVTGEGIPTGHPVVPVLKVTGDPQTASALPDDIDVDARTITADDMFDRIVAVAGGEMTAAERHGVVDFAISRFGPSM